VKIKKLGDEYRNTCIAEFVGYVDPLRLLDILKRLKMISKRNYLTFSKADIFLAPHTNRDLIGVMNAIAPSGYCFDIQTPYEVVDNMGVAHKHFCAGFFNK